jgi:hypothetical protein
MSRIQPIQNNEATGNLDSRLNFARSLVIHPGLLSDAAFDAVRSTSSPQGEIAGIVSNVALNILTNYFNHVAQTEVDFPKVSVNL